MTAFVAFALVAGCSGDDAAGGDGLSVRFLIFQSGANVACSAVTAISEVEVNVLTTAGTELPGFPKTADCAAGEFASPLASGSYQMVVTAYGRVGTNPRDILFRAETDVVLPSAAIEVSLRPRVASLRVDWSFEQAGNLVPCDDEVETISLTVSGQGTGDAYNESFACRATPVDLPIFFKPRSYTVLIEGYSGDGFKVYDLREMRLLEAGDNVWEPKLDPEGSRVLFQWQFELPGGVQVPDCAHGEVGISDLVARVTTSLGDEPVEETIDCATSGEYAIKARRWTQGTRLMFSLTGEGVHRFRRAQEIVMGDMDERLGELTLPPVGTATLSWSVTSSSACANNAAREFDIVMTLEPALDIAFSDTFMTPVGDERLGDIRYGTYNVAIVGRQGNTPLCTVTGQRLIDARDNDWPPFEL